MNTEQINESLEKYKRDLIAKAKKELSDYGLGFAHGLEYALALHNKRPCLYVDKNGQYSKHDMDKFPEYFL